MCAATRPSGFSLHPLADLFQVNSGFELGLVRGLSRSGSLSGAREFISQVLMRGPQLAESRCLHSLLCVWGIVSSASCSQGMLCPPASWRLGIEVPLGDAVPHCHLSVSGHLSGIRRAASGAKPFSGNGSPRCPLGDGHRTSEVPWEDDQVSATNLWVPRPGTESRAPRLSPYCLIFPTGFLSPHTRERFRVPEL